MDITVLVHSELRSTCLPGSDPQWERGKVKTLSYHWVSTQWNVSFKLLWSRNSAVIQHKHLSGLEFQIVSGEQQFLLVCRPMLSVTHEHIWLPAVLTEWLDTPTTALSVFSGTERKTNIVFLSAEEKLWRRTSDLNVTQKVKSCI